MKRKPKTPAKRAPMPEGYDGATMTKQQGSPALHGVGGVHALYVQYYILLRKSYYSNRDLLIMDSPPSNDNKANYCFRKGNDLLNSGNYQAALDYFDKAVKANPIDAEAWSNRGIALASLNRFHDAIKSFDKAGSINPLHENAWYNKGMILCRLEMYEEAVCSLEKALEINPQNAHAWHNKGVALKRLGRNPEARFAFAAAGWIGIH